MSDVYEKLTEQRGLHWIWPNRRRDLNYLLLDSDERARLDRAVVDCGLIDNLVLGGLGGRLVEATRGELDRLTECGRIWFEATGDDRRIAAHAWHLVRAGMDLWPRGWEMKVEDWYESDKDAAGPCLYTEFCSVVEADRMLFNRVSVCWSWFEEMSEGVALGRSAPGGVDPKVVDRCVKRFRWAMSSWTSPGRKFEPVVIEKRREVCDWEYVYLTLHYIAAARPLGETFKRQARDRKELRLSNAYAARITKFMSTGLNVLLGDVMAAR